MPTDFQPEGQAGMQATLHSLLEAGTEGCTTCFTTPDQSSRTNTATKIYACLKGEIAGTISVHKEHHKFYRYERPPVLWSGDDDEEIQGLCELPGLYVGSSGLYDGSSIPLI